MNQNIIKKPNRNAFSLIEVIVVLSMAAVIIIATLNIHSQVRKAAAAVGKKIDNDILPIEILQRIAEDIDRLSTPGAETRFTINNKTRDGINKSQLIISNFYYDTSSNRQLYEQITWRAHYDTFEERTELLRSHGGIALEDILLDVIGTDETATSPAKPSQAEMQKRKKEPFILICSNFSMFEFSVPRGPEKPPLYNWSSAKAPLAITAAISFAEPYEDAFGDFIVPPEHICSRTIATSRTRKIKYQFVRREFDPDDPNELGDYDIKDPNNVNTGETNTDEIISIIKNAENE